MEGVQLADETIYPNKRFFSNKPIIILGTNPIISYLSASKRDNKNVLKDLTSVDEYFSWYKIMTSNLNSLANITNAREGKAIIKKYIG